MRMSMLLSKGCRLVSGLNSKQRRGDSPLIKNPLWFYFVIRSIDEMERAIETVTHDVRGRLTAMTISGERNE